MVHRNNSGEQVTGHGLLRLADGCSGRRVAAVAKLAMKHYFGIVAQK